MAACDIAGTFRVVCIILTVSLHHCQDLEWMNPEMNLFGRPGEGYYIGVQIGTPPQKFNVLVDTGSTNFAIAASPNPNVEKHYNASASRSYRSHGRKVSVLYTQGNWSGELGNDVLNFPALKVAQVTCDVALIQTSHNFFMNGSQWQGILGLAYSLIARPDRSVGSWLDSLPAAPTFSLRLCGSKPFQNRHAGRLTVSGRPGPLATPVVREWFYEVALTGLEVGGRAVQLPCRELNADKTIVDSGTTNLRLPAKVFTIVVELITAAILEHNIVFPSAFWSQQKMSCFSQDWEWSQFPNISLDLMHSDRSYFTLELTAKSYLRMAYDVGAESAPRQFCYKFSLESSDSGSVLGVVALEGFVVTFDRAGKTVSFETSRCGPPVSLRGPFPSTTDLRTCLNPRDARNLGALQTFAYVVASLLCVCGVILIYCLLKWLWKCVCRPSLSRSTSEASLMSDE